MPVVINNRDEDETEVIEAAIEYVSVLRNGLYRDVPKRLNSLIESVDKLQAEHDGRWQVTDEGPSASDRLNAVLEWTRQTQHGEAAAAVRSIIEGELQKMSFDEAYVAADGDYESV